MSSSPLNVSFISASILRAAMTNLLQLLVALNPLNIAFHLCKKAIDTVSFAKEGLQKCKLQLDNTLEVIVDILQQSPLRSQISVRGQHIKVLLSSLQMAEHPVHPPHPTLQQRISSPTRLHHSGELDFSDTLFNHHCHSMEATFSCDEDGEVIYT
ncbi:hypothetical protein LXA43DRAFT_1097028 [Ganoderma leucocontextum]|nr:hypothetical protein LXA43DRAFT_1097028 [Ganoderma leucocontextum]